MSDQTQPAGFVILGEFTSKKHPTMWNYLYGCRVFNTWGADLKQTKLFDTRAVARRCGQTLGRKVRILNARTAEPST